ncbi:hypothetical protein ACEPT0_28420 [Pseudomonas paraeruginosa]|uniref:hypothetical protein n=1 Tax=Pseudomonas paraeruginosa TaxID=2994495 RepID=UPI0009A30B77|nr:hypothetical protein [Pseudomonas paraeruginosa]
MADNVNASYEAMASDAMNDRIPGPSATCKACTQIGVPFSINAANGPRDADTLLGIPSNDDAATFDWLLNNRWIGERGKPRNFRDTFLLRVITRLGELYGETYLAEFYAFIAASNCEFVSIDIEMETETYVTPSFMGEVAKTELTPAGADCGRGNFVFHGGRIYFWTFTAAKFSREMPSAQQPHLPPLGNFDWTVSGFYPVEQAVQDLASHYARAKEIQKGWNRFFGALEVVAGVLSFVPIVGPAGRGLFGAYKGVRYVVAAIDAALAANAVASGSTKLITGEDIDVGEKLFASLGKLIDPKDGAERGRQVFMFINLAMLTPAAYGGAKWVLKDFRRNGPPTGRMEVEQLTEPERKALGGRVNAEAKAIQLYGSKKGTTATQAEMGTTVWVDKPSLDTNRSQHILSPATGKANYAVMGNTLRSRLTALIVQHAGSLKVVGRIAKVVGDAGEEALAATMVEKWGFDAKRILGYSSDPRIPHRFGLTNKSGHGLDILVWVPPPPEITVRVPANEFRHTIDGVKGPAQKTVTMKFTEDRLLVMETKTTLGQARTPGFNSTQARGGSAKVLDIVDKIREGQRGWRRKKMLEADPSALEKVATIRGAMADNKVTYLHAQVFFDSQGSLNQLVGNGTGIQLNVW